MVAGWDLCDLHDLHIHTCFAGRGLYYLLIDTLDNFYVPISVEIDLAYLDRDQGY